MNITLISANSYRIIENEIKKLVKTNECIKINMNKSSISNILEEASYSGFLSESKTIIVTNADFFGTGKTSEEDLKKMEKYLENPNPDTTIIFTTINGIDLRKKLVKKIKEKYNLINIIPWDKKKIREEAEKYLKEYNKKLDYSSLTYLIDNTYSNIDILFNELDKLILFMKEENTLKIQDVIDVVGHEADSNNFHFVSAVIDKDLEKSIKIMNDLKIYKVEAIQLINLLAREYRLMYYTKRMKAEHASVYDICKSLNIQEWQANKLYSNSLKYSEKEILKNIYMLGELDLKIKKGIYDKDTAIYPFLMEACI